MYPEDNNLLSYRARRNIPTRLGRPIDIKMENRFVEAHSSSSCKEGAVRLLECAEKLSSDDSASTFNCFDSISETSLPTDLVAGMAENQAYNDDSDCTLESRTQDTSSAHRQCLRVATLQESLASNGIKRTRLAKQRRIQWSNVQLYGHNVILADNPAVSSGPAVGLGWDVLSLDQLNIDEFEEYRPPRRHRDELIVPRGWREIQLLEEGYGRGEIRAMSDELDKVKRHRKLNATLSITEKIAFALRSRQFKSAKASAKATLVID